MKKLKSLYHGYRFPAEVINCAARWYFSDIEELLFECGAIVTYETIRCWCGKFGRVCASSKSRAVSPAARGTLTRCSSPCVANRNCRGRAVDEQDTELDTLLQKRRDKAAAKCFFRRVLRSNPVPRKIVTDQLRSRAAVATKTAELTNVKHAFVKTAARLNNWAENSHQPTRERERGVRGFCDPKRTQIFFLCLGPIRQHFALSSICYARHSIANNSRHVSLRGAKSSKLPKILRPLSDSHHICRQVVSLSITHPCPGEFYVD